jgi:hypothetical protein
VLLVLSLSANTSFADFPRVCRVVAQDGFLPYSFAIRGRRLVYGEGIWVLSLLSASLLIPFNGVTDKLIPLFAIGAFLAFTLSQAGMVVHWLKSDAQGSRLNAMINGLGALVTGITFVIVIVTKFTEGAWLVVVVIPALYLLMYSISHHYAEIAAQLATRDRFGLQPPQELIAVVPVDTPNALAQRALQTAYGLSRRVHVVHVRAENDERDFGFEWKRRVQGSIELAGLPEPELVILESPYRKVISPILDYISKLERENPDGTVAVLIPQLIETRWHYSFLHNQRATILRSTLLLRSENRVLIVNVPWKIAERREKTKPPACIAHKSFRDL